MVNNINALFLCHEDRFFTTPNFHVFKMYAAHQGGQLLRTEFSAPDVHYDRDGKPAAFWGLNGSASRKGNLVTLTAVNPDPAQPSQAQIALRGAAIARSSGTALAASDLHAHNSFENPDAVKTAPLDTLISAGILNVSIPPASVIKLELTLS
jgi:alpha-N-arabinofuranosidase